MTETDTKTEQTDVPTDEQTDELRFEEPDDAAASIVTGGDPIRSWASSLQYLYGIDEVRLQIDEDGLSVRAVDAANVGMVELTASADGFSGFQAPDGPLKIGMALSASSGGDLNSALGYARKRPGDGDPVRIDVFDGDSARVKVQAIRPDQQTKRVSEFFAIDPDSIRQEPDIPNLRLPHRATPGVDALADAVDSMDDTHDHVWLSRSDATLMLGSQPGRNPNLDADSPAVDSVLFPNAAWSIEDDEAGDGSLFSVDYLKDIAQGLKTVKADRVTVEFGEEFPAIFDFDNTDWGFSGKFMVAPRIRDD